MMIFSKGLWVIVPGTVISTTALYLTTGAETVSFVQEQMLFLIALLGYVMVLVGLCFDLWIRPSNDVIYGQRSLLGFLIGVGYYVFMLGFASNRGALNKISFIFWGAGSVLFLTGLLLWHLLSKLTNLTIGSYLVLASKGLVALWIVIALSVYLIYWGAPIEFWDWADRSFVAPNGDNFLRLLQDGLSYYFSP